VSDVKYPQITVKLVGKDGNAYAILGRVKQALNKNRVPKEEVDAFLKDAMSGGYNKLLRTCMEWVNVR
jgi:hypothetical protein